MRPPLGIALCLLCLGPTACGNSDKSKSATDAGPTSDGGGRPLDCPDPDSEFVWPVELRPLAITDSDAWSPRIAPDSAFLTGDFVNGYSPLLWSKWSILLEDPTPVYFQDSRPGEYPFHYDFASSQFAPFRNIARADFDAITLHAEGQKIALGAVLFPKQSDRAEYGVQIVSLDPLHPKFVKDIFERIQSSVDAEGLEPVYVPTGEQAACAEANRDWYAQEGISLGSVDAWLPGDQCYSEGWAVGRIVSLSADEVEAAALDGTLTAEDILLLEDSAPAELPAVAGILTLAASTPNSHTAILAKSYGVPFAYLRQEESAQAVRNLVGKLVVMGAATSFGACEIKAFDLTEVDEAIVDELRTMSQPGALEYPAKTTFGAITRSVDGLMPSDIATVGGKAANYGILRSVVPDNSRPAVALTMDLWDAFTAQEIAGGQSLHSAIDQRLGAFQWPPAMAELDTALSEVRALIREQTDFSSEQRSQIEGVLSQFSAEQKLRFRSSTNVEDGASFSGAGLYSSAGGCLADDTDADEVGPSHCNPAKANERGIYRAIKKVYASFYRRNAFVERLRRGVDESEVGMAILVHHSFPDATEMANGVAVLERRSSDALEIVSQPGAVSVTNPEGNATPELVTAYHPLGSSDIYLDKQQNSSLVPLGATVLTWEDEYKTLANLLLAVLEAFPSPSGDFALDFEFKKIEPGDLVLKQVRPLPLADTTSDVTPLLLDQPTTLCVFEGEASDVFSIHRMKSTWTLRTRSTWLDSPGLSSSLLKTMNLEYVDEGGLETLTGTPLSLPGFVHSLVDNRIEDRFDLGSGRQLTLLQRLPSLRRRNQIPALALPELFLQASVNYDSPQLVVSSDSVTTRSEDFVILSSHCPEVHTVQPSDLRVERSLQSGSVKIDTAFYWPPGPTGVTAGYTAPLQAWGQTQITGLTSSPIILASTWSQSQRPEHHNFGASYLFEPRLEPGLDAALLAELVEANIKMIYATEDGTMKIIGLDDEVRDI